MDRMNPSGMAKDRGLLVPKNMLGVSVEPDVASRADRTL